MTRLEQFVANATSIQNKTVKLDSLKSTDLLIISYTSYDMIDITICVTVEELKTHIKQHPEVIDTYWKSGPKLVLIPNGDDAPVKMMMVRGDRELVEVIL